MLDDGFAHNPKVSHAALAELHAGAYGWALSLTGRQPEVAEDVMQQQRTTVQDRISGALQR